GRDRALGGVHLHGRVRRRVGVRDRGAAHPRQPGPAGAVAAPERGQPAAVPGRADRAYRRQPHLARARAAGAGDVSGAGRRSIRLRAGRARTPQARAATPPMTRAQRAPNAWPAQPTSGPPIGVEPSQASAHSAITRPRIAGLAASWRVVLASELNVMLP